MRYAFKMWNGKRMGPVGLLVALVVLASLSPLTRAQSPPTTLPLTAVKPWVLVNNPLSNAEATFTEAPGSVTFTLGGATATVSLVGPTTITGTSNGLVFNLSMPTSLTLSDMQTGVGASVAWPSRASAGVGFAQGSLERSAHARSARMWESGWGACRTSSRPKAPFHCRHR
jgi:hypothetical protein